MNPRAKQILLLLLAAALLFSSGRMQKILNRDRDRLGLTRVSALENAPPLLAFTTVALGGFRGLIANALWIRANDLQQEDKFFEAAQLATWITDLEPHFTQVWIFQGWNMAYNISVKFKENAPGDFTDRWRWVERGIELLRDDGLRYNPNDVLIHRELAWDFQHKIGANLDDGNVFYKQQWALEMAPFFGPDGTNFTELLQPQSTNALRLREKYKIDPAFAQQVDAQWGPLDWRLPEAHAIYWGARGLDAAGKNPDKVKPDDLITLRRIIYQSVFQAFKHGRVIANPFTPTYALGPNLDLIPKANEAYETMMTEDAGNREHISKAHRNFLRDAIYFLYVNNRVADAGKWFKYLSEKYPNLPIIENDPTSLPRNVTLDEFAFDTVQIDIGETSQERVTSAVQGLLARSYYELAAGADSRYQGYKNLSRKVYDVYQKKQGSSAANLARTGLAPYEEINRDVLNTLLSTQKPVLPFAARAIIRTQLGLPAETNSPPATTNSTNTPPRAVVPTNALPAMTNSLRNASTNLTAN